METLRLNDGTLMEWARVPGVDDNTWADVKKYLETNPDMAKNLQSVAKNPEAIRGFMQTQIIHKYYSDALQKKDGETGPKPMEEKFKALENDPELTPIFEEIKKDGMGALLKLCNDEELMLKFSRKMGGIPDELKGPLQTLSNQPMTLHEAAKNGDVQAVKDWIAKESSGGKSIAVDTPDHKGITALGYAVGADRFEVTAHLLSCKANLHAVDAKRNTAVHYAAGYGRKQVLEFILAQKADPNKKNSDGQSPMDVATRNGMQATIAVLRQGGAV
jgi:hypothetical protein